MALNGWKWLKWSEIAGVGLRWLEMARNGWKWLIVPESDKKWMEMIGNGINVLKCLESRVAKM